MNTVAERMASQGCRVRPNASGVVNPPRQGAAPTPDLVRRAFTAEAINVKWFGDLTEIPTEEGPLYLATTEDLLLGACPATPSRTPRRPPRQGGVVHGGGDARR